MRNPRSILFAGLALAAPIALADEPPAWCEAERSMLVGHQQLTSADRFARAGEAYFSPDGRWIVFQAVAPAATGGPATNDYSIYLARLTTADEKAGVVCTGFGVPAQAKPLAITEITLLTPPEAASTCAWFNPREPWMVIFGSTMSPPAEQAPAGFQRGTSTYAWKFPRETEIMQFPLGRVHRELKKNNPAIPEFTPPRRGSGPTPVFTRDGYDAECSYSPDGRHLLYTHADPETRDADIWVFDTVALRHTPLVERPGYDGGAFFSPDGKAICYRSDVKGNDLLQVFVATLDFDDAGATKGVKAEFQVTDNDAVNWAPFWHPSGEFLVYTTSEQGHDNYEIYSVEAPVGASAGKVPALLRRKRITHAPGFDGLPALSADGTLMMWTSQRGGAAPGEERASSQLWIARVADLRP
ncbi:MAG TPA: hypothetical protein DEB06_08430 [Phycisphaerales bacterium]|nr:hypothetical protein [Phycisphaerales bacterium]